MAVKKHKRPDLLTREWKEQAARIKARDGHQCAACGSDQDLTVDHVESVHAAGDGKREDADLITLCRSCNSRKGARTAVRLDYRAEGWY